MDFITVPIGWLLKFFSTVCGNSYILAILLFSVVMEILMALIFGIKQQKNSIKQARLRPKEMAIRKKYQGRDDKPTQQKMTQEIQELYQKEGYNPMSGCLPLLIQFPLLIALYNIVINPLKYICGLSDEAVSAIASFLGTDTTRGTMVSSRRPSRCPHHRWRGRTSVLPGCSIPGIRYPCISLRVHGGSCRGCR